MTIASHLIELRKKHEALGVSIEKMQRSPGSDYLRITDLKKQKARLKEEITRLFNRNRSPAVDVPKQTLEGLANHPLPAQGLKPGDDKTEIAA